MQTPNHGQHKPNDRSWFGKNRRIATLAVLVLLLLVYFICRTSPPEPPALAFEPLTGAVITDLNGNGDGQLNPGEQAKIKLRLANTGKKPTSPFDLVLSTSETGVKLIDNRIHFNAIEPGQTALSEDPFEFALDTSLVAECVAFLGRIRTVARAGLVDDAFAGGGVMSQQDSLIITLAVISNYRACVVSCTLAQGVESNPDSLTIAIMLCNSSSGSLPNAAVKIDSITVKRCTSSSDQFQVVRQIIDGFRTRLDSLRLSSTLLAAQCRQPDNPASQFKLMANIPETLPANSTLCVYFTALIYRDATLVARSFIGTEARVLGAPSPGILGATK